MNKKIKEQIAIGLMIVITIAIVILVLNKIGILK